MKETEVTLALSARRNGPETTSCRGRQPYGVPKPGLCGNAAQPCSAKDVSPVAFTPRSETV
jgi:hypothetical protein